MPSRQGKHLPHDSNWQKAMSARVMSTAQVSSSAAMMPPDPRMAPACAISSKSSGISSWSPLSTPSQWPARLQELQLLAVGHPTCNLVDHLLEGHPQGYLDHASVPQVPGKAQNGGAFAPVLAYTCEPLSALVHNLGNIGQGLDIVYVGWLPEQAYLRRKGRSETGHGPLTLDRLHQGRFFARHIRVSSERYLHVKAESRAEDILPQDTHLPCLIYGVPGPVNRPLMPMTNKHVAEFSASGVTSQQHPF